MKSLSRVWLLATPWAAAYQAPPSMGFFRQEHWSGVPLPSPGWVKTGWLFTTGVLLLLSHLACLHLSFWFCLVFCLFFNLFASYSVPIGLPVANHPHQLLTTCHVLFSGTYVLLISVDSEPWDIAVLIPKVFVVYDDLKQYHHQTVPWPIATLTLTSRVKAKTVHVLK